MAAVGPCIALSSGRADSQSNAISAVPVEQRRIHRARISGQLIGVQVHRSTQAVVVEHFISSDALGSFPPSLRPGAKVSARNTSAGLGAALVVGLRASSENISTKPEPLTRTPRISASAGPGSRRRVPVLPVRRSVDAGSLGNAQSLILRGFLLITA